MQSLAFVIGRRGPRG